MLKNQVVLVTEKGEPIGLAEKMLAHQEGLLHLAFSVMIYRETAEGREYLLQQRALSKYHSGGLWTNTCCSHPMQGEAFEAAATRRLFEELGIETQLEFEMGDLFCYRAELDNNLIEHELDQIILCKVDDVVLNPNPDEVMSWRWWPQRELALEMQSSPERFTAWFTQVVDKVERQLPH
ncbi:isopentenyl-diphosphate Delta-isomerase [Enterovibrio nigricans]|uniref:Isopentenyl-diphosphate Delta-isomerase n=1 Tax=Enterovibrio nigricans DSM 22720 TaxID=1121868 RepID=A0A1T4UPC0_9GAMM|nr:isopentenyl-diphosphate Delta-isomerase [Enterovibrio nigricans]PKF50361.1 isopentenyl-diphosphate Delta-isomerase [Enterovibrio nigricans]SKA54557.1 isopentenyl-diphosphate delta-isomerase [Enterovibrio nigricans DSM 22720]